MESGGKLKFNVVEVVLSEIRLGINVGFIAGYFDLTIYGMNFFFLILETNSVQKGHSACS